MNKEKLDPSKRVALPMSHLPIFRTQIAIDSGVERNLLFRTWGGIGDQICAEPTIRYALNKFKDCRVSLASELPQMFSHLNFKRVFDLREEHPNYTKYFLFDTITPPDESNLVWQFFSHMLTNCVDFPSLCALRLQLPVKDREILLVGKKPDDARKLYADVAGVVIHPGKHWQSKTFPKSFWDAVIKRLRERGVVPMIIGADADDNRGTVDVDTTGCIDLRNKLSISESIWLLQRSAVLLTNDSSPMHMAASTDPNEPHRTGQTFIGYIATCKHPDMITHWRHGEWQYRETNFGKGGIWDVIDFCPNKEQKVEAEFVPPELLLSWLPDPIEYADWAVVKANEY